MGRRKNVTGNKTGSHTNRFFAVPAGSARAGSAIHATATAKPNVVRITLSGKEPKLLPIEEILIREGRTENMEQVRALQRAVQIIDNERPRVYEYEYDIVRKQQSRGKRQRRQ